MTAVVGFPTLRLVRVRMGQIQIANMKPGDVIEVDEFKL
jgi:23S rRNA pseudouridine2457 synthase